ncbi:MAG TPA: hypothetical protein VF916_05845 [Ktedonobacterales bacterium]|jgi:hypothetical protein
MSEERLDPAQPVRQEDAARSAPIDRIPVAGRGSSLSDNAARYRAGSVIVPPQSGIGYPRAALGPGNEAMEGGLSPAPRGFTGGAMGKYVAGLSPSFPEAAMGLPPPGGNRLYTLAELVATFGEHEGTQLSAADA